MAYVSGASLQPIVNRLNSAAPYHPMEANTFADWSLEAGDTVTVSRDGTSYASPVHTSKLTWRKQAQVAISSTGNETRESISKLSSQRYRSGNSGLRNSHYQHIYVNDLYDQMTSGLELTGSTASLYVQNLYAQMKAGLDLTSSTAHLYVNNMYLQMKSGLQLTASSASLYVQSMYDQMKAGLDLTSSSARLYARTIDIEASRVKISGNTYLNGILSIANGRVKIDGATLIDGDLLLSTSLSIRTGNDDYTISAAAISTMIKSASVDDNVLTLTRVNGTTVSFSKAVTIGGTWSSGTLTISVSPNNATNTYKRTIVVDTTTVKSTDKVAKVTVRAQDYDTSANPPTTIVNELVDDYYVDVTGNYNAGYDASHSMFMTKYVSSSSSYVSTSSESVNAGSSVTVYPTFLNTAGNQQRGTGITITAKDISHSVFGTKYVSSSGSYVSTTSETVNAGSSITIFPTYTNASGTDVRGTGITITGAVGSNYIKKPAYIMTDGNRYQNWYTCALYDSNYNYITTIAGGSYSGMYIPLMDAGTLEAGTYSATASTGNYGGVYLGYRSFTVPSGGGSSGPSHYDNFAVSVTQNASGNHVSITKTYPLSSSCPFSNTSSKRFYWN